MGSLPSKKMKNQFSDPQWIDSANLEWARQNMRVERKSRYLFGGEDLNLHEDIDLEWGRRSMLGSKIIKSIFNSDK